ncbi:putative two component sensor kinase [Renibacterium salmoninarum ATCC 33209]|uniref:histidine kinase n=1 Tax=Renibacterium salmoninarum (strain ATCC 33209 / DSM 20767 / JCM 11484 / NBRC 15589 / NCIMB 2235) TaxID=288705 RepID=A9WLM8_RENSM|nr:putative two component sensor kinase [Renibacterium salmoninarum ATCC 33209]
MSSDPAKNDIDRSEGAPEPLNSPAPQNAEPVTASPSSTAPSPTVGAKQFNSSARKMTAQAGKLRQEAQERFAFSRWSLRSKMVLATLGLLTAICFIVGMISYATMSLVLNNQLNVAVRDASSRVTTYYAQDVLRVTSMQGLNYGTMVAYIHNGALETGLDGNPQIVANANVSKKMLLPDSDMRTLTDILPSDGFTDRKFTFGSYRLIATRQSDGNIVLTGLPNGEIHDALTTLVLTILLVSASGLIMMGLIGTVIIRRAMAPLDKLAAVATRVSKLPLDEGEVKLAERVPPSAANEFTEIGTVGLALNRMLDNVAFALQSRQRSETKVRQFVADASHELRTPLTAIRGYTEMIKMTEELSASGEKSLSRVESQSKRMGAMVEDLLTLARLDEGKPLELNDTEMTQLVVETVNDMKVAITDHQWKLDLPSDPFILKADSGGIRQVLLNLLSNAAKHTDAGTVVTTSLRQADANTLRLTVADNGPGIPKEFQSAIFDRFSRVDVARSGHDGTTGLGLSIVQAIVAAHGGTISLASEPGRTQFIVDLPRNQ